MSYGKTQLKLDSTGSSDAIILTASSTNTLTVTTGGSNPVVSGIHTLNVTNGITINSVAVATQDYVSNIVQGRTWRPPVRVATTASVTLNDVDAGYVLDGVTLVENDRVLIKDQASSANGIYVVQANNTPPTRAQDFLSGDASHVAVVVGEGTNADKAFLVSNNAGSAVIGTNTLTFVQFGGSSDVADGSITAAKLASDAVITAKILNSNVTADKLATDAVTTVKIAALNVTTGKIALLAVGTAQLADSAVTMDKLANASVDNSKIQDGQVTAGKLATDAVVAANITALNVTEAKLADSAVATAKLANGAVNDAKLASNAVTTIKILDANVTAPKLASTLAGARMVLTATALDSVNQTLDPVICATTTGVTLLTALVAGQTIDGITLTTGDRVLVRLQSPPAGNGIYIVQASAVTPVRAPDLAAGRTDQVKLNATVFVATGSTLGQTTWRLSASDATYPTAPTVGTNTLIFAQVQLSNSSISSSAGIVASKVAPGTFGAGTYSFASSTLTDLGIVSTADINGGTIDGATIATSNITVGSGKSLIVSGGGGLTTNILTATDNLNIGAYSLSAQVFLPTSDRDAKANIETMDPDDALENVCKMRGVKFDWKSNGEASAGVIAQEMQDIAPELVARNAKNELSFNYDGLNGYLIPAIQVLAKKCKDLEEEVNKLKRKRSRTVMSNSTEDDDAEDDQPLKAQPRLV